jgi:hypothetical protein
MDRRTATLAAIGVITWAAVLVSQVTAIALT